jgi:hypothetical protein
MRSRRWTRTLVLPVPAFAWTQTLLFGFAAWSCSGENKRFEDIYALALSPVF